MPHRNALILERYRRAQIGFTLIEMIVVVLVLGMVGGLVMLRQPPRSPLVEMEATVKALTGAMRLARSRAIVENRAVSVLVTETGFVVEGQQPWRLPSGESLTPLRVLFMADGGSTGGSTRLTAYRGQLVVSVNWLTGSVQVKE